MCAPKILFADELFEDDRGGQPGENAELRVARRRALGIARFDPLLNPFPHLAIGNVHVFEADVAAVRGIEPVDQIAQRHRPRIAAAERGHDFAVEIGWRQTVMSRIERRAVARSEAERIEFGRAVAVNAVADDELIDAMLQQPGGLVVAARRWPSESPD